MPRHAQTLNHSACAHEPSDWHTQAPHKRPRGMPLAHWHAHESGDIHAYAYAYAYAYVRIMRKHIAFDAQRNVQRATGTHAYSHAYSPRRSAHAATAPVRSRVRAHECSCACTVIRMLHDAWCMHGGRSHMLMGQQVLLRRTFPYPLARAFALHAHLHKRLHCMRICTACAFACALTLIAH